MNKVLIYVSMYEEIGVYGICMVEDKDESCRISEEVKKVIEKELEDSKCSEKDGFSVYKGLYKWSVENSEGYELGWYEVIKVDGGK